MQQGRGKGRHCFLSVSMSVVPGLSGHILCAVKVVASLLSLQSRRAGLAVGFVTLE